MFSSSVHSFLIPAVKGVCFRSLLSVEAVKAVDHHPRRLLIISPFPLVPGDCDLVEITVVQSPPPHRGLHFCLLLQAAS